MASTYPLDVVAAERWLESNKNLKDDALKAAVDKQNWDQSIKALAAVPDVLAMMSGKLDWTKKLGDAVVAQQADVLEAVQRRRAKAQANNRPCVRRGLCPQPVGIGWKPLGRQPQLEQQQHQRQSPHLRSWQQLEAERRTPPAQRESGRPAAGGQSRRPWKSRQSGQPRQSWQPRQSG